MRKSSFVYANTKMQISCAVTAQQINAFVFATWIVQSLYFLNPKFQASGHLPCLYSPVCVGPGQKHRKPVLSQPGSIMWSTHVPRELIFVPVFGHVTKMPDAHIWKNIPQIVFSRIEEPLAYGLEWSIGSF